MVRLKAAEIAFRELPRIAEHLPYEKRLLWAEVLRDCADALDRGRVYRPPFEGKAERSRLILNQCYLETSPKILFQQYRPRLCKSASFRVSLASDSREDRMRRFVEGTDRAQATLFPECLEDWICEDNPVRAIDVFVDELDLAELGFGGVDPEATGRPSYHPSVPLKLYIYGYLNRVQSSRRLEREASRNVEVMWLTGRLVPDHKTIADFRKDNGPAIRKVCAQFVALCREMGLLTKASVAIDGSKFKAVNNRDKNFTRTKMERRLAQIEESVARYLSQLDTADLQEPSEALASKTAHLKRKIGKLRQPI